MVGLKTHCKLLLLVRREGAQLRRYAHLGTGNYHPRTARLYTDLSLLTARPDITSEVAAVFNTLTGLSGYAGHRHLMVAPFDLAERLHTAIERERRHARAGRPARIIIKINSLVDEDIISALYAASGDGVEIDLIVRGICCLRPGIPGVSERIRVRSIVGRFLEHSRIYYFGNGGKPDIYLGSADWMPRNFYRRVEVAFPLLDPVLKRHVEQDILPLYLKDNVKARVLQPDGSYLRLHPADGAEPVAAQYGFREIARRQREEQAQGRHKDGPRLTPVRATPPLP